MARRVKRRGCPEFTAPIPITGALGAIVQAFITTLKAIAHQVLEALLA
ncbi:MAG: hypothetical protein HYV63_13035 [Candidatus Schekmanbacteria bacterium]|nr:hypothetical protein [Candidatus Schekmanbacteria bacterium]